MTTEEILIVAGVVVALLIVLGLVLWLLSARRRKHRDGLRQRYGREYDATVDAKGRRAAVEDLDQREGERESLHLREPDEATRSDLRQRMADLQFRFVEEPHEVLLETQRVVVDALRARGYPIAEDRERALRLLSVDHPERTPALRTLLDSGYGQDTGRMPELFIEARSALLEVLDVSYTQRDLAPGPARERAAQPTRAEGREPAHRQAEPGSAPREGAQRMGAERTPPRREPAAEPRQEPEPRQEAEPRQDAEPRREPAAEPRQEAEPRREPEPRR